MNLLLLLGICEAIKVRYVTVISVLLLGLMITVELQEMEEESEEIFLLQSILDKLLPRMVLSSQHYSILNNIQMTHY